MDDHLVVWRDSPAAVIGVVVDPADDRPRWVHLTLALRDDPKLTSVFVEATALFEDDAQVASLLASVRATTVNRYVPFGIGSRA